MREYDTIRGTARRAKNAGLGITECAIRRWAMTGDLHCIKSGNRMYVSWSALLAYLGIAANTKNDTNSVK